jgi:quercetin dioxygenase-like cupin family protein
MQRDAFTAALAHEGFAEPVTVMREAGTMDEHTHPFEAKALILAGELRIRIGADERLYQTGDVFHLQPGVLHAEQYGAEGVQYLVGRKQLADNAG